MIFPLIIIVIPYREKVPDKKDFSRENSNTRRESRMIKSNCDYFFFESFYFVFKVFIFVLQVSPKTQLHNNKKTIVATARSSHLQLFLKVGAPQK